MAVIWKWRPVFLKIVEPALGWSRASPHLFYPCFFILTSEFAHLFKDSRWLAENLWHILKPILDGRALLIPHTLVISLLAPLRPWSKSPRRARVATCLVLPCFIPFPLCSRPICFPNLSRRSVLIHSSLQTVSSWDSDGKRLDLDLGDMLESPTSPSCLIDGGFACRVECFVRFVVSSSCSHPSSPRRLRPPIQA